MGHGPLGLRSIVDQPPLPTRGAHRSSAYGRSRPRRLAVTAQEGEELTRVRFRASPKMEERRGDLVMAEKK
jgi:hypothetical protein